MFMIAGWPLHPAASPARPLRLRHQAEQGRAEAVAEGPHAAGQEVRHPAGADSHGGGHCHGRVRYNYTLWRKD